MHYSGKSAFSFDVYTFWLLKSRLVFTSWLSPCTRLQLYMLIWDMQFCYGLSLCQVKECTSALLRYAKSSGIPVLLVGWSLKLFEIIFLIFYVHNVRHLNDCNLFFCLFLDPDWTCDQSWRYSWTSCVGAHCWCCTTYGSWYLIILVHLLFSSSLYFIESCHSLYCLLYWLLIFYGMLPLC